MKGWLLHTVTLTLLGGLSLCALTSAEDSSDNTYVFPIPDQRLISGTFGELRGSHFHAGLDIRTDGRTGLPVVAARSGYIYRAVVSHAGYGKVVYVRHSDNTSTVYAHLERFTPTLEARFRERQTEKKQFNQELFFRPEDFPLTQGQVLGFSGNTGSSAGPHLHFEVRDAAERILNPIRYFRSHVPDVAPPMISRVAFEPLDPNSRINGLYDKHLVNPSYGNGVFTHTGLVRVRGKFGVEFTGFDRLQGTTSFNGLYSAEMYLDGEMCFGYKMDQFSFADGKYIFSHSDFAFYQRYSSWLQRCYVEAGNRMPIYFGLKNNGVIELTDDAVHEIKLVLKDFHGNASTYIGRVQRDNSPDRVLQNAQANHVFQRYSVKRGMLVVETRAPRNAEEQGISVTFADGTQQRFPYAYGNTNKAVALVPLENNRLPVRAEHPSWTEPLTFSFTEVINPAQPYTYRDSSGLRIFFPENATFDRFALEVRRTATNNPRIVSDIVEIGHNSIPLNRKIGLTLAPYERFAHYPRHQIVLVELTPGGGYDFPGMNPTGSANLKRFGKYCLMVDTEPPILNALNFNTGQNLARGQRMVSFRLTDALSGVNGYGVQAWLDGQWRVIEFYSYQNLAQFYLPEGIGPGNHTLKVVANDNAGNSVVKTFTFGVAG